MGESLFLKMAEDDAANSLNEAEIAEVQDELHGDSMTLEERRIADENKRLADLNQKPREKTIQELRLANELGETLTPAELARLQAGV